MFQLIRQRRIWILGVGFVVGLVLLLNGSGTRDWLARTRGVYTGHQDDLELEDVALDDLFRPVDTLHELYSSDPKAHRHSVQWKAAEGIPTTHVLAHVPGFTVLRNVYIVNGTLLFVTEHRKSIPPLKYMLSAWADLPGGRTLVDLPTEGHAQVINKNTALRAFGLSARLIRDTTWICNDPLSYTEESFIFDFLRTHYMQEHRANHNESLLPPTRILFPRIPQMVQHKIPGLSSIPRLLFPSSGVGFKEDWNDYSSVRRAFMFETVVLLDRAAAARNPKEVSDTNDARAYLEIGSSLASFRPISGEWWSMWRQGIARMIGVDVTSWHGESVTSVRPVITYITRQGESTARLNEDDHHGLVACLKSLETKHGYAINIVDPSSSSFIERLKISLSTTIMLGATSSSLADVIWMHPNTLSLLLEFFPEEYITTRRQRLAEAVGVQHLAWKGRGVFTPEGSLFAPLSDSVEGQGHIGALETLNIPLCEPIRVDAGKVCEFVVSRLERNQGDDSDDMRR